MNAGMSDRSATVTRETGETSVSVTVNIDGSGEDEIHTGIGFFDHMVSSFATHGLFDITVEASGDLEVDDHHTVEDVGIVLGSAFDEALGKRDGIVRFADRRVPLDESVSSVVVDLSGRPLYRFTGTFSQEMVGDFTSHMARHFWRSFVTNAGITAHVEVTGSDAHHEIESLFKSFARALDDATQFDERRGGTPSTKGSLTE